MARNRKSQSLAIRFGPALKAFLLCLLIGGSGVGYVWQKEQLSNLGNQIRIRELRLAAFEKKNDELRKQLANMLNPQFLELRIKEANLGLVPPQPSQILRLKEPAPEPSQVARVTQTAAQGEMRLAGP